MAAFRRERTFVNICYVGGRLTNAESALHGRYLTAAPKSRLPEIGQTTPFTIA